MNNNELRSFTAHQAGGWATPILYERAESSPHLTRGLNVSLLLRACRPLRAAQAGRLMRCCRAVKTPRKPAQTAFIRQFKNGLRKCVFNVAIGKGLGG